MNLLYLTFLFPLIGFVLLAFSRGRLSENLSALIGVGSVGLSAIVATYVIWQFNVAPPEGGHYTQVLWQWIAVEGFTPNFALYLDGLSVTMLGVVVGVGFLIHLFASWYMRGEAGYSRFFAYTNLFIASMLFLVLGDNLLFLYFGWEGVGLCSYLLIGFYFLKKSASDAGKKAFIVNRIGDAGFILGILLTAVTFATIRFTSAGLTDTAANSGILQALDGALSAHALAAGAPVLTTIALLLFVGATGKSAQIPLYVWLPDAMEGPTPVSALIHAATMVTAGVYMVVRMNAIYRLAPLAMDVVAVIGVVTAIFAASMALVQNDIKKVLAYSTISQLGYMFLALGVGAFAAGIFHLMTHAFFKALLFLGAGSVIHAMSGEQDIQKMGGLWGEIPVTARTFFVATLAIAGIPPLAGFFSKDEILGRAFERHPALWIVGFITAGMTAFYMFRLVFLTFFGYSRADNHAQKHIHESPRTMTIPLMILAVLSVVGGWIGWPASLFGSNQFEKFLEPVMSSAGATESAKAVQESSTTEYFLMLASIAIAVAGIWVAYEFYRTKRFAPELVAGKMKGFYRVLFHKYYVDEIYDALFVNRTKDLGTLLGQIDAKVIDGVGVDGTGWLARFGSTLSMWWDKWIIDGLLNFGAKFTQLLSFPIRFLQTGTFSTYALLILVGLAILLAYYQQHLHVVLRGAR